MTKATGLAAFSRKNTGTESYEGGAAEVGSEKRSRGKGDVVALTVRLPKAEWERIHQLAVSEGLSIQALAVKGFSNIFKEKGLPPLKS